MILFQKTHAFLLLCGAILLLAVGCQQKELDRADADILYLQVEDPLPETRVAFNDDTGAFAWVTGDQIAIHYSDNQFRTKEVNILDKTVVASPPSHTVSRDFYAVYPADIVPTSYSSSTLTLSLSATYDISDKLKVPMVAVNNAGSNRLKFYHVGGLLRIYCDDVPQNTKTIKVTLDKDITGDYTVTDLDTMAGSSPEPKITTRGTASSNVVTFTVSSSGLAAGTDVTLNIPVPIGTYAWAKVETYNGSTLLSSREFTNKSLVFTRHLGMKLSVEELRYTYHMSDLTSPSGSIPLVGGDVSLSSTFASYRTNENNESEKVQFILQYKEGSADWSDTPPSWLNGDGIDYAGSLPGATQSIGLTVQAQANSSADAHVNKLRNNGTKTNLDLSKVNPSIDYTSSTSGSWKSPYTSDSDRSTANCYVVQSPGTFQFPVVYGNALKKGVSGFNTNAFVSNDTDSSHNKGEYATGFFDHNDSKFSSSSNMYIAEHLNKTTLTASLLWTDSPGLVINVQYQKNNASDKTDDYISFEVPSATICQGNALIAAFDGNTIVWSWHIWVTDENLSAVKNACNSWQLTTVNLGWCEQKTETFTPRSCQLRAVQNDSGIISSTVTISQVGRDGSVTSFGDCPYYQYGRKDPLWAALNATTHKSYYTSSSTYNYRRKNGRYSHGIAIQEPFVMYTAASSDDPRDWSSKYHFDSWDSMYNSSLPTKTIYDPCPVGFLVPPKEAFSGFTASTTTWSSSTPKGLKYTDSGLFFPAFGELDRCNYNSGATNDIERYGEAGYYTTCSPSDYQQDRVRLFFDSTTIAVNGNGKGNGQLVRPAKER